jgi:hypothetical protein
VSANDNFPATAGSRRLGVEAFFWEFDEFARHIGRFEGNICRGVPSRCASSVHDVATTR